MTWNTASHPLEWLSLKKTPITTTVGENVENSDPHTPLVVM